MATDHGDLTPTGHDAAVAAAELAHRLNGISASVSDPDLTLLRRRSRLSLDSRLGLPTPDRTPLPSAELLDDETYEDAETVDDRHRRESSEALSSYGHSQESTATETNGHAHESVHARRTWRATSPFSEMSEIESPIITEHATPNASVNLGRRRSTKDALKRIPTSLLDYLANEVRISDPDGEADPDAELDLKSERLSNFINVPLAVERIIWVGMLICLDAFLHIFTILPLRFARASYRLATELGRRALDLVSKPDGKPRKRRLPVSAKVDLVKGLLFIVSCTVVHHLSDASQMYHSVRGQEHIKLYVIFNVLEVRLRERSGLSPQIADRLCCAFGQDMLDSLFSRSTLGRRRDGSQPRFRAAVLFFMCTLYVVVHTLILIYQLVTLNVAVNYYSNMLLTLLLSNQFTEIKSAVFKKFEKENLFQMSCADIVERFQLTLLLSVIALRNLVELSGSTFAILPASYIPLSVVPSLPVLQRTVSPALIVLASEALVDWLKHAFITKFNHIRPAVYGRFIDVLCKDLLGGPDDRAAFVDQSPQVSRRLGFAAIPLSCLVVRVVFQTAAMLTDSSHLDDKQIGRSTRPIINLTSMARYGLSADRQVWLARWAIAAVVATVAWGFLILIKLLLGIYLRAYASSRVSGMAERALEDRRNDRKRPPIGVTTTERRMDAMASEIFASPVNDALGKKHGRLASTIDSPADVISMEALSRFDLVKSRVW